ncbi:MAG TPA: hypothetical protein VIX19_22125 [Terriglobales bacterium]
MSAPKTPPVAANSKNPPAKVAEAAPPAVEKKPAPRPVGQNGRRDPFVSPIRSAASSGPSASCSGGKRCLSIPELVLQGTVKDISGKMMAVVVNSSRRTYMLRENDQVFNGSVEKITTDSIIFREFVKDALGRETAHEVVKKLGPAS